jgi:hypothetical protein
MALVENVDDGRMTGRSSLDDVIEVYKRDVDRTLLRENLKLSPDQRVRKMIAALEFVEELRRAPKRPR